MALKPVAAILLLLPLLAYIANAQTILDITKYGAKPGADISPALTAAWKDAIVSETPVTIVIPSGTWSLSQLDVKGPNKAHVEISIEGYVKAPTGQLPNPKAEWITVNYVDSFEISGGGTVDGQGQQAWKSNDCHKNKNCAKRPLNFSFNFIKNAYIHDVTSKDSKNFHLNCISSQNVTFQRFTISTPGDSINTDGIHLGRDSNIRILDSVIATGDDCISMNDEMSELYVENVTCGPGHGISVGSLGGNPAEKDVVGIYVRNCTFIGTTNGIRIKTWPSGPSRIKVKDLYFEDLIMNNVSNPIIIDQEYCPHNICNKTAPSYIKISDIHINNVRGTSWTQEAVSFICSPSNPCTNVEVGNVNIKYIGNLGKTTTLCKNVKPTLVGKQYPPICAGPAAA